MGARRPVILLMLATLTAFTLHLVMFSYSVLMRPVANEFGITWAEAGLVFSISIAAIVLARIPLGFLTDRLGYTIVVRSSLILIAIFGMARGFSANYQMLLVCQILVGVGFAPVLPCLAKIVSDVYPHRAGLATGLYAAGFPLGEIAGIALSSWVLTISEDNWRLAFIILGVWSLLMASLWWLVARDHPDKNISSPALQPIKLSQLLCKRQIWLLTGLCACAMGAYDTLLVWAPQVLQFKGISAIESELSGAVIPAGFLIAGPLVGLLSDRAGRRKPFLLVLALGGALCTLAIAWVGGFNGWIMLFLSGFALSGLMTLVFVIPAEDPALSGKTGTAMGLITSLGNAGSFFLPIALGAVLDATSSVVWALGLLAAAAVAGSLISIPVQETGQVKDARVP
jgi:nitrate/nitrite transporter NarK